MFIGDLVKLCLALEGMGGDFDLLDLGIFGDYYFDFGICLIVGSILGLECDTFDDIANSDERSYLLCD